MDEINQEAERVTEPRGEAWRLNILRRRSHEQREKDETEFFGRGAGTGDPDGART
jgi:hypothetical protein